MSHTSTTNEDFSPSQSIGEICESEYSPLVASDDEPKRRTFVEALIDRYDSMEGDLESARDLNIYFVLYNHSPQRLPNGRVAASYSLSLDRYLIEELGSLEYIRETCERVTALTLAKNKIKDWTTMFQLLECMPNLKQLDLSGNLLGKAGFDNICPSAGNGLTYLSLSSMDLNNFKPIENVLNWLPNLAELNLSRNEFKRVDFTTDFKHSNLERINLCRNSIEDSEEVARLGKAFPALKELILALNPIKTIHNTMDEQKCRNQLRNLQKLSFNNTLIDNWESVATLKNLPNLKSIYFRSVPLARKISGDVLMSVLSVFFGEGMTVNGCLLGEEDILFHKNLLKDFFEHYDQAESLAILNILELNLAK